MILHVGPCMHVVACGRCRLVLLAFSVLLHVRDAAVHHACRATQGLYGERVGALTVVSRSEDIAKRVESQLKLVRHGYGPLMESRAQYRLLCECVVLAWLACSDLA